MVTLQQLLDRKGHAIRSISPGEPVLEAVRMMAENHIGALLVMEQGKLLGIVSERDYARKIVLKGRSSASTPVREIMSSPVATIAPDRGVEDAMREMTNGRFRHLPVVAGGQVVGVVSIGDLVKCVIDDQRDLIENLQQYIRG
ncbi:MAG: CBS domain-containing protein [Steroidobacteraceae bacterium]